MKRSTLGLAIAMLLISPGAQARVFDFNEQAVSTYLRGTFGTSNLQRTAYAPGYPSSVAYPDSTPVTQGFSGEFGVGIPVGQGVNVRIGVELLYPANTTGASGKDASGNLLFSMDEQVYSVIPQGDLEILLKKYTSSRFYMGLGGGYAVTTLKNTYTMAAQGSSTFGLSSYIEEGTGWGIMGQAYVGYEFVAFDNVTLSLDVGYRYLTVSNYSSNRNFTAPYGTVTTGQTLTNSGGGNRYTDLSGFLSAVNFRFYFH